MVVRKRKVRRNTYKAGRRQRRKSRLARIRWAFLTLVGLVGFAVFNLAMILAHDWLTQTRLLPIAAVDVEGAQRLTAVAVRQRAQIGPRDNILSVNLGAARRRLQAHPWIAEAKVIREIPDRIIIRIREHECRAVLNLDRPYLLSADGVVFKVREAGECGEVPMISGIDYADLGLDGQPWGAALQTALDLLDTRRNPAAGGRQIEIREIRADPDLGLTLFVHAPGREPPDHTVVLGFADWPPKYKKLEAIQSYLDRRGLMPDARIFNLRDPDRIVISPGAGPAAEEPAKEV
jgi:cell division protein FtsQ